jgi:hypothetical protein
LDTATSFSRSDYSQAEQTPLRYEFPLNWFADEKFTSGWWGWKDNHEEMVSWDTTSTPSWIKKEE